MPQRAVFLDRDGTIIDDTGFIRRVEDVRLLPNAAEAIGRLNAAGWLVVVVTNQSGVARGLLTEKDVAATNKRMTDLLKTEGAHVDAIYYCPHLPEGKVSEYSLVCDCRKPRPGMLIRAAEEHDINLAGSVMTGDAPRDVEAGLAAGTRAILLTESPTRADQAPDACGTAPDLVSAVREILDYPATPAAGDAPAIPGEETPAEEEQPEDVPPVRRRKKSGKQNPRRKSQRRDGAAKGKKRKLPEKSAVAKPEKEKPVSEEEKPIPVHRAPKEFMPEREVPEEEPASAGAEEPATSPAFTQCGRCGGAVPPSDVKTGRAYDKDGISLCRDCIAVLQAQRTRSKDVTNEDILRELQNITRALTYERFSYWHVLGAISQATAIGTLIITYFRDATPEGLLWATFFQLLALTFFILGRQ